MSLMYSIFIVIIFTTYMYSYLPIHCIHLYIYILGPRAWLWCRYRP